MNANEMISVSIGDVPKEFHDSAFFASLGEDDGESITIPRHCFNVGSKIESIVVLREVLSTLRFWGAKHAPRAILSYFLACKRSRETELHDIANLVEEFRYELPFLKILDQLSSTVSTLPCTTAASYGLIDWVKFLHEGGYKWNSDTLDAAALGGHLSCVQYMVQEGLQSFRACYSAAKGGRLNCLKYLHEHSYHWDGLTTSVAVEQGHLHCLNYAHDNGCPLVASSIVTAAETGHLGCFAFLHEHGMPIIEEAMRKIVKKGHIAMLSYAHQHGGVLGTALAPLAAKFGHLSVLQYLHAHGCPWDSTTVEQAALNGQLSCLSYALDQGCEKLPSAVLGAVGNGHLDCLQLLHQHGCAWQDEACKLALSSGRLDILQFLRQHGCPWSAAAAINIAQWGDCKKLDIALAHGCHATAEAAIAAARCRSDGCLRVLRKYGCPWDERAKDSALKGGFHNCLRYLHEQGCPWGAVMANRVPYNWYRSDGYYFVDLFCIEYALQNGCPLDRTPEYCAALAERGMLDVLKLTIQYGGACWDERTVLAAIRSNKMDVLTYALEQGCPTSGQCFIAAIEAGAEPLVQLLHQHKVLWDGRACDWAIAKNNLPMLRYLHENGCPWGVRKANNIPVQFSNTALIAYCYSHSCPVSNSHSIVADMALHGKLKQMTIAHTHGAPWDERTPAAAATGGHLDCLTYAHEHGCPWDHRTTTNALQQGHLACLQYACEHGCAVAAKALRWAEGQLRHTPAGQYLNAFAESNRRKGDAASSAVELG